MVGLSMAAIGLWTCGLAYCSRYSLGSEIPKKSIHRICPPAEADAVVAELVETDRWLDRGDVWIVADAGLHGFEADRGVALATLMGHAHAHICIYCGAGALSWDHVVPRSRGGTNEPANLVPACRPCNSSKGARTPEEWWIARADPGAPFPRDWPRSTRGD